MIQRRRDLLAFFQSTAQTWTIPEATVIFHNANMVSNMVPAVFTGNWRMMGL
jgi:hypothetical protein